MGKLRTARTQTEAQTLMVAFRRMGFERVDSWRAFGKEIHVHGSWYEPVLTTPSGTTMPRGEPKHRNPRTGEPVFDVTTRLTRWLGTYLAGAFVPPRAKKRLDRLRLFSVATRQYLRRRAWRYFRRLGKLSPQRYVAAVSQAMIRYADDDVADGLALIDNWGLVHALFHRSPTLVARPAGWVPAEGHTLAELSPAPIYERLWEQEPRAIVGLLTAASCRPVRQWAVQMVRRHASARAAIGIEDLFRMVVHHDSDVVALGVDLFNEAKGLEALDVERWLELLENASPDALEVIIGLMQRQLNPARLTLAQVVRLAASRPLPVAGLGVEWLKTRVPRDEAEERLLLSLTEAHCEPLRGHIVRLVGALLSSSMRFDPRWVLEFLDCRHADVRSEGIVWFRAKRQARDDVTLWRRLMESPHDDVRLFLISELEARLAGRDVDRIASLSLDADALRLLWASVLLNIHRGSRAKPLVVRQLVRALERRPEDAASLLPILSVALRSARGRAPGRACRRGRAPRAAGADRSANQCGLSGVEVVVMLCDDLIVIDPASGRAVSRDLHATAFRRGRHWLSLCVPEAVVLSLPRASRRGTESTVGLPQRLARGSFVNALGPRLEVGPARPPAGSWPSLLQTLNPS